MLRSYQQIAIEQIRAHYSNGIKKVMLVMPTGAGKTVVFSEVMGRTADRGMQAIMVVRGRELVEQASQRLFREKIEHGVRMSGHWNRNYSAPIQICSIDTLRSRDQYPKANLVVIDESDLATSPSFLKLSEMYSDAFFLPVTATPYCSKSLRHIADEIVRPITIQQLIDQGHLVGPKYYAPSAPNMRDVKIVNDDFHSGQTEERMGTLTGDIVSHWIQLSQRRPSILFAVNIHHSHQLRDQFLECGVRAEHIDADTTDLTRKEALSRLQSGDTEIICNVGILGRGVDMPWLGCVVMARPTRSYNLFIQQAGRGTRTYPGKSNFILLDHAGNIPRHGFITVEPPADLDGRNKKIKPRELKIKICQICYLAYQERDCPDCGPQESTPKEIEITDGNLEELVVTEADAVLQYIQHCKQLARDRGYKPSWIWYRTVERFGKSATIGYVPSWFWNMTREIKGT